MARDADLALMKRLNQGLATMDRNAADLADIKRMDQSLATMARDTAHLADIKRQDQGNNECEVLTEGAEGAKQWEKCTKNPGHVGFIPAPELSLGHLPEKYRDEQFFQYIRYMMDLTVKITVKCASVDRPDGYPFSKIRGQTIPHTGSGSLRHTYLTHGKKVLTKPCPCSSCEKSDNTEKECFEFIVMTAKHVVFNNEEARNAVIELYYDHKNRDTVKYLYGVCVFVDGTDGDRCQLMCVTHDAEVAQQLVYAEHMSLKMHEIVSTAYNPKPGKQEDNVCVLVSHPHGRSKHVTIGHWKECFKEREDNVRDSPSPSNKTYRAYTYDTPTCPGSSGACIIIMSSWDSGRPRISRDLFYSYTHSSGNILNGQNANISTYWPIIRSIHNV